MILIPIWLFIIFSILSAIGGVAILLMIFAHIRVRQYENEKDNAIVEWLEKKHGTKNE